MKRLDLVQSAEAIVAMPGLFSENGKLYLAKGLDTRPESAEIDAEIEKILNS